MCCTTVRMSAQRHYRTARNLWHVGWDLVDSLAAGGTADHLIATNCKLTFVFALFAVAKDANRTFCVRATRGCNKVPYRACYRAIRGWVKVPYGAPYRAIGCAIRYLVAPPCGAMRCVIRYLVAPTCCTTVTPNRSIFKKKVKASTAIKQCCSTLEGLRMQPLKKVSWKQQPKRLKMAEQILRSLLQDGEVQVRMTHHGAVHLRGGCASVKDGINATVEEKKALRVVRLVPGMRLSIRQMYSLPRACRKKDLDAARQQHTPYWCTTRAVVSETGAPRASASNKIAEVVNHQISLSQAAKTPKTRGPDIIVVLSADAIPLWKASATRCDISVHCWQQPSDAGVPNLWPIWWAMWGADDTHFMLAMDKARDLNGQVQDLCHDCGIVLEGKTLGFKCVITGDRKNMHAANPSSKSKCWICEEDNGLAIFVGDMNGGVRWGAYLRYIPTGGRVGDRVHATCRILCILVKWLRGEFHKRGIHVGVRELDGEMHEIKEVCKGIPEAERIAPRWTKEESFDLTRANAFMANPQWADTFVTIAKARMGNVETPTGPLVWVVLRTLLHQFAHIHRFWRQKEFFADSDVAMDTNAVDASVRHGGT